MLLHILHIFEDFVVLVIRESHLLSLLLLLLMLLLLIFYLLQFFFSTGTGTALSCFFFFLHFFPIILFNFILFFLPCERTDEFLLISSLFKINI